VDEVDALIQNVDFVLSVSVVWLDLGPLSGYAGATPGHDVLLMLGQTYFCRSY
jgi:hypothetical protein